ncbi:hypothetical protein VaNZ11_008609 [Volvox africanus]|uniref:Uncharacterized protein n=1 Tax=Volvox africanus TaxID=51714 RepID=A0ABQ5S5J0_9CHLO|nr:hypothetical protein VaNZ11_008609 [Volvox africanus]
MSSDLDDELGGEEEEVIAAPDDAYDDDDFDGVRGDAAADDEPTRAQTSYAADDEYKDDLEPEFEPEPSRKAATVLDEEPSYQDDFEQSMAPGLSKMPDEEEDRDATSAAMDVSADNSVVGGAARAPGSAVLAKSTSGASRSSSRPGSATAAAPPKPSPAAKPSAAAAALKPTAAPKPAAAASTKTAAVAPKPAGAPAAKPLPVPLKPAVSKPAAPAPKAAVPAAPKPAVPRATAPAPKPAAPKPPAPVVAAKPSVPARNMVPAAPAPVQPAATGVGLSGQKVKLTFTGPPNTQRAAPTVKPDYSHSNYEVNKINSDNVKLCNRLVEISRAPPNPAYNNALSVGSAAVTGKLAPANVAAATVNRHRKEDEIAQENLALYKRLQAVKPSSSVNREVLNKEFVKTQAYGENARKVKVPPAHNTSTSGATAGANATKLASSGATRQPPPGSAEEVYSRPSGSGSAGGGSRGPPDGRISNGEAAAAADLSTVMEGPEGEVSDGVYAAAVAAAPNLEPEYSMDPEFDQAPSQSFAA